MNIQTTIILVNLLVLTILLVMHQVNKRLFRSILLTPIATQFIKVDEYESSNKKLSYLLFYLLTFMAILLAIEFYDLRIKLPFINEIFNTEKENDLQIIYWSLIIGGFLLLKTSADHMILYILDIKDQFRSYIKYKFLLSNYCLILFVPVILFSEYNELNIAIRFHEVMIGLLIIYVIGQMIYFSKNDKTLINNLHYIILYLCTFEFGTYFVLYQLMID